VADDRDTKRQDRAAMKPLSPDARADRRLAVCLAVISGYVDGYGLCVFATYVSFMSGNTTQTGAMTGQGNFAAALPSALAIVFWVALSRRWDSRRFLLGMTAAALAVTTGVMQHGPGHVKAGIMTLSLAMGMMNTTLSRVGAEAVSPTFVTGTLSRIGSHLAMAIRRAPLPDTQGPWDTHLRRARLLAIIWTGFLIGAVLSGAAISYLGVWVLMPPLLILLALTLLSKSRSQSKGAQ
jgi:uncharacterized membrane protein YoaK (UPF0700 family)